MNKEIWKDIQGYEGYYQVSNYGRIRGLNRVVLREKMGNFIKTWDSIALVKKELGINHISDCCNGKRNKAGGFIWRYYQ